MESEKITFRPINSGLGLNHYNDVLPKSKSTVQANGKKGNQSLISTNATSSAGPVGVRAANTMGHGVATGSPALSLRARGTRDFVQTAPQSASHMDSMVTFSYASPFVRSLAFVVDATLAAALFAMIVTVSFHLSGLDVSSNFLRAEINTETISMAAFFSLFVGAFFLIQEMFWGKTLGLALFGLELRAATRLGLLLRFIFFPLSILPFGLGLLWAFFDEKNRAWHDVISGVELIDAQSEGYQQ